MATIIAEYYTDELVEWNRLIDFNNQEMDEFEDKLAEVIQRNTIPNIAAKVEEHQDKLNIVAKKFYRLQEQIQQQEAALKTDSALVDDTLINPETETHQNELRRNMQRTEKEYIDTKYACYNFLSGTLKK
ncbi:MAG: hypothetical protein Q8941_02410 [Bacteroidota bacterium]|nr:hypothetical protein [Bacteroidota bacterium]